MKDTKLPDHYKTLGLVQSATGAEIRGQYRELSKQLHPDMGGSQQEMAALNEAYSVLSDQFRRSIYDAERRRALRVPSRAPEQPIYAPPRRKPAPHPQPHYARSVPRRHTNWWAFFAWSFAILVVTIGILTQLPLAETNSSPGSPAITSQSKPLDVSYQPTNTNSSDPAPSTPTFYTAPDGTKYHESAETPSSQTPAQNTTTCDGDSSSVCYDAQKQQTQPKKNCVTKAFGLYKRTICSSPSGSNNCADDTVGAYRYATCD